jgi:hypothetical protein
MVEPLASALSNSARVRQIENDDKQRPERPRLRVELAGGGQSRALEAVRIRDRLRRTGGKIEEQLATIIDAEATELLAALANAGTVSVRMDTRD